MIDANEEIVRRWLELRGYLVRTNVPYRYATTQGAGWSDVDLCGLNPQTDDAVAVEVKGWHTESITPGYLHASAPGRRDYRSSLFNFTRPEASAAIAEVFSRQDFRRILVVSRIGPRGREEVLSHARERGVEMIEFHAVLEELIDGTPTDRSANSDLEHAIRVLKIYGFIGDGAEAAGGRS